MLTKLKNKKLMREEEGFTIIEVMIVLAIAGLILLIVFLAIPALQRNAHNTQRKNDAAAYAAAVAEDTNNSSGTVPTTQGAAVGAVKAGQLTNIDYNVGATFAALPGTLQNGYVYIRNDSVCGAGGGGQIGLTGGTQRQVTVTYIIEEPGVTGVSPVPNGYVSQCVTAN